MTALLALAPACQKTTGAPDASGSAAPAPAGGASSGAAVTPAARQEAEEIFKTRCAACHGATGAGDGVAAAGLNPKPRNYGDMTWQASVTDAQIEKVILEGGQSIGKSPLMVANPDLATKPATVAALREKVRSFGKK